MGKSGSKEKEIKVRADMTLDEAITHAEKTERDNRILSKRYDDASGYSRSGNKDIRTSDAKKCEKCAEDHRQIAKWLKDYKRLLEQEQKADSDCISRKAVLNILDSYSNSQSNAEDVTQDCISDVLALSSVQQEPKPEGKDTDVPTKQEPKAGRWKKMVSVYDMIEGKYRMIPYTHKDEELGNPPFYVCDCGNNSKKPTHYCPDCGAKMEVEHETD